MPGGSVLSHFVTSENPFSFLTVTYANVIGMTILPDENLFFNTYFITYLLFNIMSLSTLILRKFIIEEIKQLKEDQQSIKAPTQAPNTAIFGNYAFPRERSRKSLPEDERETDLPQEEDTQEEIETRNAIFKHMSPDNTPLDPKYTGIIKNILNSRFYKKVFRHPEGVEIYRGMSITTERLKKYLGLSETEKLPDIQGEKDITHVIKSRLGPDFGSSWTINFDEAKDFGNKHANQEQPWNIVFVAAPGEEKKFLAVYPKEGDKKSGMYRIVGGFDNEDEAISLGPIKVSKIYWWAPDRFKGWLESEIVPEKRKQKKLPPRPKSMSMDDLMGYTPNKQKLSRNHWNMNL